MTRTVALVIVLAATGCGSGEPAAPPVDTATVDGGPSNDRTYYVAWQAAPDPIPIGASFALDVWILEGPDGGAAVGDTDVRISAWMPDHLRWMERDATITPSGTGHFKATEMLFPMAGRWEMYVDVTRHGLTERAQFMLRVE